MNTVFFARLDLVAYINLRCLAVTDQNDGEAGLAALCGQGRGAFGNFGANLFRKRLPSMIFEVMVFNREKWGKFDYKAGSF